MSIFEHQRWEIWNQVQHPYKHSLDEVSGYSNGALPGVSTFSSAMDWVLAVLYPIPKAAVATPAALPSVGNTIGDYRVVIDDGDGKSAGYRWEQREGDATAKWYKIYDMDFGAGSVLQQAMDNAQELFVQKWGNDDLDSAGVAVTGVYAGQVIYGGKTASKNLTLRANAGDGVGARTGFVQVDDIFRPAIDDTFTDGSATFRWSTVFTKIVNSGASALTIIANSITAGSVSTGGIWTIGATSGVGTHIINGLGVRLGDGTTSGSVYGSNTTNTAFTQFCGGINGANGATVTLFGSAHATSADVFRFDNSTLTTGSISAAGLWTIGASGGTQSHVINGQTLTMSASSSGGVVGSVVSNTSNTASSHARMSATVAGTSAGNALSAYNVSGTTSWSVGCYGGSSQSFAIANTGDLTGTAHLSITTGGLFTIGQASNNSQHRVNGRFIDLQSSSTGTTGLLVTNANNANAAAHACLEITTGGTSGGDPYIRFDVTGTTTWSVGGDTSDTGAFKISENTTLGTNDRFKIASGGNATFSGNILNSAANTYDIGASGTRFATIFAGAIDLGSTATIGNKLTVARQIITTSNLVASTAIITALDSTFSHTVLTGVTITAIQGVVAGVAGQHMIITTAGAALTIANENAGATAANRITTNTGADVVIVAPGSAFLIYDANASRWMLVSSAT